jgi:hypothetical protein
MLFLVFLISRIKRSLRLKDYPTSVELAKQLDHFAVRRLVSALGSCHSSRADKSAVLKARHEAALQTGPS